MLLFDDGASWEWKGRQGEAWIGYDFHWYPGRARSRLMLGMHRPDICLAAVGLQLADDRGTVVVDAAGYRVPFQAYRFMSPQGPLYVYYALYRSGAPVLAGEASVRAACLQAVVDGRRSASQQVLQLAVRGLHSTAEADLALRELLQETVRRRD